MATSRLSTLGVKITIPVIFIAVLAILLTAFLNHGKFERTTTELESARIRFVVNDIKANLETGLGLGLSLKSLANAQEVIDFEARKDASILSIAIYDETGAVVFHSGREFGTTIPKTWQQAANERHEHNWQIADADSLVVGTSLSGAIGMAGGVALRYSRQAHNDVVESVAQSLKLASAAVIALTVLAALVGVNVLVRQTDSKLKRIEDLLDPAKLDSQEPLLNRDDSEAMALAADVLHSSRSALRDLSAGQQASQDSPAAGMEPGR